MPPQRGKSGTGRLDQADEIGSEAAKKYNGLFSEKDWKCKLCSNINWARRNVCNQCQSPKPGTGTDAHREGHGGGFFDRGGFVPALWELHEIIALNLRVEAEIEYRETRYQDDDEYDDFGRLKKKKRNGSGQEGSAEPASRPGMAAETDKKVPKQDRDDDDDDDDDGDGDDGKWDAWADILGDDTKTESIGTKAGSVTSEEKTYAVKLERDRSPHRDQRDLTMVIEEDIIVEVGHLNIEMGQGGNAPIPGKMIGDAEEPVGVDLAIGIGEDDGILNVHQR
ncbi:hypothetical protein SpCBS45565_g06915 [Spizellomyces sp. 'palustris']|nr:hypothetical protein SpCBS45565_g06915 [Spizellomyces sp. 'palustris']